ncbi:unnamed protein product [Musa textilis]
MVVKVLQRIAHSGSIVIMSVHQPSYRILCLLDRLLFLSRGQTVYSGPPDGLHRFFADFGHPISDNENPTEFALDFIRESEGTPDGAKPLVDFNNISRGKLVSGATERTKPASSVQKHANPFWIEMAVLTKRSFTNTKRMPELFAIRLGAVLVTGFILATIFWRLDNSPKGVQERLGFFAIAMSTMFYTCADALPVFLQERNIFMRETAYNAYRRSSYVLSHAIVGFPPLILLSIAFALTTFFAVGLSGGTQGFFFFVLIVLASFWAGSGFVTFLSGVVTHVMLGYTVVVAILAYFLLFSGFFITRDRIHDYWIWFHYMSLVKYPYEAVMQNEFDDPHKCFARGSMSKSLGANITAATCITTGTDILKQQSITQLDKWDCLWVTVAWGFFFRFLFYVSLLLGSRNKRRERERERERVRVSSDLCGSPILLSVVLPLAVKKMGGGKDKHAGEGSSDKGLHGHGYPGYPPAGYPPPPGAYQPQAYPPAPGGYPPQYGYPPQGYPPTAYPPVPGGYPPQGYPPTAGYPGSSAPPHQGHGSHTGALIAGGAAAAAAAYGAHHLAHGNHHAGHGGYHGHMPGHHGKFKHGKFKHGKYGKHKHGKHGKFRKWK